MKRYDYLCDSVAVVTTAIQPASVMQYISIGLTIIATIISICFSVYNWYKKAKEDKKISQEELEELENTLKNGIKDIKNIMDKEQKRGD